jgi:hypothetical protein
MLQYGEVLSSDIHGIRYWFPCVTVWRGLITRRHLNNLMVLWWCYSTSRSYRRTFIVTKGDVKDIFCNKVFCGWDFSISTQHAAELKSNSIYNDLVVSVWVYNSFLLSMPTISQPHLMLISVPLTSYSCVTASPYFFSIKSCLVVSNFHCLVFLSNSRFNLLKPTGYEMHQKVEDF